MVVICSFDGNQLESEVCSMCLSRYNRDTRVPNGVTKQEFTFYDWRYMQCIEALYEGKKLLPHECCYAGFTESRQLTREEADALVQERIKAIIARRVKKAAQMKTMSQAEAEKKRYQLY